MTETADQHLIEGWQADPQQAWQPLPRAWQRYATELHERLLRRWVDRLPTGSIVLKTDLFEEAMGEDYPSRQIAGMGWRPLGMDVGRGIAAKARGRGALDGGVGAVVNDVRRLAFADGSLPAIFCNSTLDHFKDGGDIDVALAELKRVLAPGGQLILTLDNPRNPVVGLRNALPRRLTDTLGITDFHVGPTLSLNAAIRRHRTLGFEIREAGTFMHSLRYLALERLRRIETERRDTEREFNRMISRERRASWPTAQWTGHFIYVIAQKPEVD